MEGAFILAIYSNIKPGEKLVRNILIKNDKKTDKYRHSNISYKNLYFYKVMKYIHMMGIVKKQLVVYLNSF